MSCPARRITITLLPLFLLALAASARAQPAWRSVSVGDDHVCALDADGRAFCLGNNHSGQLGARTPERCGIIGESGARGCYPTASEPAPVAAGGGMRFASIHAGRYVTCGIDAEGRAFCWGDPMGDTAAYRDPCMRGRACSFSPVPLDPARRFAAFDGATRCGVAIDGRALCWETEYRKTANVSTPWPMPVASVSGDPETRTLCAAARDGQAYCRGEGRFGLRGTGLGDSASAGEAPVAGTARFTQIVAMEFWACGLDREGAAHCWGTPGNLGIAPRDAVREGFERCGDYTATWCNRTPVRVSGPMRFRSITAMPRGSMPTHNEIVGLTADGRAWVWGGDRVPRPWHAERRWRSVSAGDWGQCGVSTRGELFCWGRNPHEEVQGLIPHPR